VPPYKFKPSLADVMAINLSFFSRKSFEKHIKYLCKIYMILTSHLLGELEITVFKHLQVGHVKYQDDIVIFFIK